MRKDDVILTYRSNSMVRQSIDFDALQLAAPVRAGSIARTSSLQSITGPPVRHDVKSHASDLFLNHTVL